MKIKVGIVGATGYAGEEIIKILLRHNAVEITSLAAVIDKPTVFSEMFPAYRGRMELVCNTLDADEMINRADVVFLALPHTVSMQYAPIFLKAGKKVIDLSADYRLDEKTFTKWYKHDHIDKDNINNAVYGLPELYKEKIKKATLLANPGCYPTATILAAAPAVKNKLTAGPIITDAKSGVTGAGRKASIDLLFAEVDENLKAYKINEHQHMPEIAKYVSEAAGQAVKVNFVPHLIPIRRGILSTVYIPLKSGMDEKQAVEMYKKFYKDAPFVRVYQQGRYPEIKNVVNTNYCDIGVKVSDDLLIIVSCIDNLIKGAAGQAVQNMNIMCSFPEEEALIN